MTQPLVPGLDVSRETLERLTELEALTRKWTAKINLIAPNTVPDIWDRHIRDSAQIYSLAPDFTTWADLGSGGGYPGLVIAALAIEKASEARITLIESDRRKSTFLRTAIRELGLPADVITDRIESAAPQSADVVSARALAPLPQLLEYATRHLRPGGTALFPKGMTRQAEIDAARAEWHFSLTETRSITQAEAAVLRIERIDRV